MVTGLRVIIKAVHDHILRLARCTQSYVHQDDCFLEQVLFPASPNFTGYMYIASDFLHIHIYIWYFRYMFLSYLFGEIERHTLYIQF